MACDRAQRSSNIKETPSQAEFIEALYAEHGLIKDSVCRYVYTEIDGQTQLYILRCGTGHSEKPAHRVTIATG